MKLSAIAATLCLVAPAFSLTIDGSNLWLDEAYDNGDSTLYTVACSNGERGLITRGYNVLGSLPTYPFVGGIPQITEWDSPYCGTCLELVCTDMQGITRTINFLAINTGDGNGGITISWGGGNALTGNDFLNLNGIAVTASSVDGSWCGMRSQ